MTVREDAFVIPGPTHEVLNQPPPIARYNVFDNDLALVDGLTREGGAWATVRTRCTFFRSTARIRICASSPSRCPPTGPAHLPRPIW